MFFFSLSQNAVSVNFSFASSYSSVTSFFLLFWFARCTNTFFFVIVVVDGDAAAAVIVGFQALNLVAHFLRFICDDSLFTQLQWKYFFFHPINV